MSKSSKTIVKEILLVVFATTTSLGQAFAATEVAESAEMPAATPASVERVCACPEQLKECIPAKVICEVPKEEMNRTVTIYTECQDNPCSGKVSSARTVSFKDLLDGDKTGVCGIADKSNRCIGSSNQKISIPYGLRCRKKGGKCVLEFGTKREQCKPGFYGGQDGLSVSSDPCSAAYGIKECSAPGAVCEVVTLDSSKDCKPGPTRKRYCAMKAPTPTPAPATTPNSGSGTIAPPLMPTGAASM